MLILYFALRFDFSINIFVKIIFMLYLFFAGKREAKPLLDALSFQFMFSSGQLNIYSSKDLEDRLAICIAGVGKVASGSSVALLSSFIGEKADQLINIGVAGSINPDKAGILDAVISTSLVQHDVDTTPVGDPAGLISGINKVYFDADENIRKKLVIAVSKAGVKPVEGIVASGDQFVASDEQRKRISETFGAITVDMEAAAEAQVAYMLGIPFCSLKVISDANDHAKEYRENEKKAAELAAKIILEYLQMD